jgi:hypothetical protein
VPGPGTPHPPRPAAPSRVATQRVSLMMTRDDLDNAASCLAPTRPRPSDPHDTARCYCVAPRLGPRSRPRVRARSGAPAWASVCPRPCALFHPMCFTLFHHPRSAVARKRGCNVLADRRCLTACVSLLPGNLHAAPRPDPLSPASQRAWSRRDPRLTRALARTPARPTSMLSHVYEVNAPPNSAVFVRTHALYSAPRMPNASKRAFFRHPFSLPPAAPPPHLLVATTSSVPAPFRSIPSRIGSPWPRATTAVSTAEPNGILASVFTLCTPLRDRS